MAVKWGGGRFFRFTKNGINKTGKNGFKTVRFIYIGHDQSSIDRAGYGSCPRDGYGCQTFDETN